MEGLSARLRSELLNGEMVCRSKEAQIVMERRRRRYTDVHTPRLAIDHDPGGVQPPPPSTATLTRQAPPAARPHKLVGDAVEGLCVFLQRLRLYAF